VDTFGLLIACRVEPADISDRRAAALLLGGLGTLFPNIRTVIADAGHQSRKLARHLLQPDGWKLQIVKRRQRAFKITGLIWIVETCKRLKIPIREYLCSILPGLANFPINQIARLTPACWLARA